MSSKTKTRKLITTDELFSVELVDASGQQIGKLKSLQNYVALHLSEKTTFFQLEPLRKQLEQDKGFQARISQSNMLGECAEGHKKSVEYLQLRNNGKLLQQSDRLQDAYDRAIQELENKRQQHQLFNAEVASCYVI